MLEEGDMKYMYATNTEDRTSNVPRHNLMFLLRVKVTYSRPPPKKSYSCSLPIYAYITDYKILMSRPAYFVGVIQVDQHLTKPTKQRNSSRIMRPRQNVI